MDAFCFRLCFRLRTNVRLNELYKYGDAVLSETGVMAVYAADSRNVSSVPSAPVDVMVVTTTPLIEKGR